MRVARSWRQHAAALTGAALLATAGCSAADGGDGTSSPDGADAASNPKAEESSESSPSEPPKPVAAIEPSIADGDRAVAIDQQFKVTVSQGAFDRVQVMGPDEDGKQGPVAGDLNADKTAWVSDEMLEPRATYRVTTVATGTDGKRVKERSTFTTEKIVKATEETYPSVYPLGGSTVGVGMPVVVEFDVPVRNRAAFERRMHVKATPQQPGTWHWIDNTEVHWRPRTWWKAGTTIDVNLDLNSVHAGGGVYGQLDRRYSMQVGDDVKLKVNVKQHNLKVVKNGRVVRQLPITAGNEQHETRSGIKVISEKFDAKRMNSATVGIDPNSSDGYNIANVQWAMRVTDSGEFLHAAPWSTGSQGSANVSHGCVGMATDHASYVYDMSLVGTPVIVRGTDRTIEADNGLTDWDMSWAQYKRGSALN